MQLVVDTDGTMRMIHTDAIDPTALGAAKIERASHVEPNADCTWSADLSPVGGPVLGPFPTRGAALEAETLWLERHWL
ncbi:MAG: hypothetical protein C0483_18530 [Pirellula sp.]|nr:hypothetical protein [Pirellula sp.]